MKVLTLTDEQYAALRSGAPWSDVQSNSSPKLPGAKELHRMVRSGETPEVFALTRERVDATSDAATSLRGRLHSLILEARRLGVKTGPLMEWSGYSRRRITQISEAVDKGEV